jgi:NAD(P)-dependent dehydrogenase (short-subunit alcohol dehydrogenase family)
MLLKDKVVVVSGVGPGLGQAIATQCASQGADLVLAARTESTLEEVAKQVSNLGRRALCVRTDITSSSDSERLVEAALGEFGHVDTLVNNVFAMPTMKEMSSVDVDSVRESFEGNVLATLRLTQLFTPALQEANGSIIFIGSAVIRHSRRTFGTYKMAKASLLAYAQSLSSELGPRGVRVNTIAPSYIWADLLKGYFEYLGAKRGVPAQQVYDEIAKQIDLRRLIEPDEIADVVVFLASQLSRAITGQCIDVNGGEFHA